MRIDLYTRVVLTATVLAELLEQIDVRGLLADLNLHLSRDSHHSVEGVEQARELSNRDVRHWGRQKYSQMG